MKKHLILSTILLAASLTGMAKNKPAPVLKDIMGGKILIGCALNADQVWEKDSTVTKLIDDNFNSLVAENCMKGEVIHPEEDRYDWKDADQTVKFAEKHHMTLIGHCLVWHSQPPKWMFTDKEGKFVSREVLIDRMYHHITNVVTRYKGKVLGWDVVNEVIMDDGSFRESPYYKIIGPDYIELAFKFAHAADPDAELYLNDYSMAKPAKREAYVKLIKHLQAQGCRLDAIGMQSHNGKDYPDYVEYEKSLEAYAATGIKVQMTETDVNMLPNPEGFGGADISQNYELQKKFNPYPEKLDKKMQQVFNERYLELFRIIKRHKDDVKRVTFWGLSDKESWLNDWPIKGRTNYPLLIDRNHKMKPVVKDIISLFEE